ncbi:hypothetical protein CVU75_03495, partial [Candidatus Dependentiae bacterium HGW-Dependentiae-1]
MRIVPNRQAAPTELLVGVMSGYVPFATVDQEGNLEGFDIDVAKKIASRLGRTLVFKDMSLAALLVALQQGSIDLLLSGLSITKSRAAAMAMIHYQGEGISAFPLLFWKQIPADIKTMQDLQMRVTTSVCIEPGSSQEEFIMGKYPALSLKRLSSMSEIVMDLKYGKSLAAMVDPDILPLLQKQVPELAVLWVPLQEYRIPGNGIALKRSNKTLIDAATAVIADLKKE